MPHLVLIATRAAQLVDPAERRSLADAWENVLSRAAQPRAAVDPRVPLARQAILAAGDAITGLATTLRSASPVAAGGVARVHALLTDGTGPVYRPVSDLRVRVTRLDADLHAVR